MSQTYSLDWSNMLGSYPIQLQWWHRVLSRIWIVNEKMPTITAEMVGIYIYVIVIKQYVKLLHHPALREGQLLQMRPHEASHSADWISWVILALSLAFMIFTLSK